LNFPSYQDYEVERQSKAFIDELEEKRGEELTDRQTDALIRIAKELISAIEAESRTRAAGEPAVQTRVNRGFYPSYFELVPEQARERVQSLTLRFT
jgi:hypothetical protein